MRTTVIETRLFHDTSSLVPLDPGAVKYLVIHHTGGNDEGTVDPDPCAAEIDRWHKGQGWAGIGYHFVDRKNGDIERGRPRQYKGSHAYGLNSCSLGVHVGGDFVHYMPTESQITSLLNLLADLCEIYSLDPAEAIILHRDVAGLIDNSEAATDCPGDNLAAMLPAIRDGVSGLLEGGQ